MLDYIAKDLVTKAAKDAIDSFQRSLQLYLIAGPHSTDMPVHMLREYVIRVIVASLLGVEDSARAHLMSEAFQRIQSYAEEENVSADSPDKMKALMDKITRGE